MTLKGQIGKNLVSNVAYFVINIIAGIFLTPYYLDKLGIAAYAIIPLATSLIGYIGILTNSLNSAVSRHLTIDIQRADIEQTNRTFNSAFFGVSKVIILVVPLLLLISYIAPSFFSVPSENSIDSTWLLVGIGLAFLIRAWSSNFTVTLYASNRLDLINVINLTNIVIQITSIIVFFSITTPSLTGIGLSYLLGAIVATLLSVFLYLRTKNGIVIKYHSYDRNKFKEMANMGGWIIINNVGSLLIINIDLIIVNYLFGNVVGGEYAIAYQWTFLLRALSDTFIAILGPLILIAYANKQKERIILYSKSAIRLTGIGMALPIGLLCGFSPIILSLWVGGQYASLAPLMVLLTFHLAINLTVRPLFLVTTAFNKVRFPAIFTLITGTLNVFLAFLFASSLGWGIYGVAFAGLISLTLNNLLMAPLYTSAVLNISVRTYYRAVVPGSIAAVGIATSAQVLLKIFLINNWMSLGLVAIAIASAYALFSWKFVLSETERSMIPLKEILVTKPY